MTREEKRRAKERMGNRKMTGLWSQHPACESSADPLEAYLLPKASSSRWGAPELPFSLFLGCAAFLSFPLLISVLEVKFCTEQSHKGSRQLF